MEPKRQALKKANAELAVAQEKLSAIKTKINVSWDISFIVFGQTHHPFYWKFNVKLLCNSTGTNCINIVKM